LTSFELLSGSLPFSTKNLQELIEQKRNFRIDRFSLPQVSEDFRYILERMTKFEIEDRIAVEQALFETSRLMNNLSIPK
jgi:hypothetical protein